jgi:hypothetical protein
MFQTMQANIEEKTGKSFDQWVKLAKASGIGKFKALTDHMKIEHGMTHGYAQLVAWGVLDPARLGQGNEEEHLVDELYTGKKEGLRPIYDRLIAEGKKMGDDVSLVICKTYSSLRSKSLYATVVPKTNTSVDLELALPANPRAAKELGDRLEPIKHSNPRFTHRIRIKDPGEIDAGVLAVMKAALEENRG